MADTRVQKVRVQRSSGFCVATGKRMAGDSDAGRGVCPSTGASAGNPIAAGSYDKENWAGGGVRIYCSRRRSPLPSWYHRTPLRDVTAIVRAMESRRQEKKSLTGLKPPLGETEDEGIGEVSPTSKGSTWSPCTPVSSCSPLHIFVDEVMMTPVADTDRRYSVPGMAARWRIPAPVTSCDDKECRRSTEKLNFGKVKNFPTRIAQRSSLMSMR